jgi:hypothetical protein
MGKELLAKDRTRAYALMKKASKSYDKGAVLNSGGNLQERQALKPWASAPPNAFQNKRFKK